MEKFLNKFYEIIETLGKRNVILIIFIFFVLMVTGLYQTFSIYTESEGLSIVDGIKTYSFILNANNATNSVTVAAGESKYIDITVYNDSVADLQYGLYYSSLASEDDINIGYMVNTAHQPSGVVPKSTSYIVTLRVDNLSNENVTINFGLKYGFENSGDLSIEEGEFWLNEYEELLLLSEMPVGSYVAYTGDNGCDNTNEVNGYTSCSGKNANYVSDTEMGYCHSDSYTFSVNGWRIGYIEDGSVHLVSAGATDCMCTDSDGTVYSDTCSSNLSADDFYKHIDNLDNMALKYCNKNYVKGGVCDNTTTWAMDDLDFQKITGSDIVNTCYGVSNAICGLSNTLIDNGGYYWFAKQYGSSIAALHWQANSRIVTHSYGSGSYTDGLRPVISLSSTVRIVGGTGVYGDPYIIAN